MRNSAKDELEMASRRELMLETGFRIFAEKGIEAVSMQEVANACGLGVATLYRYFNTKLLFVIAVGAKKWEELFEEVEAERVRRCCELMTAAEELDFSLSIFIMFYREHRDVLRFNQNFNNFVIREKATADQLHAYMKAIEPFSINFHRLYEKGKRDGTIRTEQSEQTVYNSTIHIMLAVCVRYAQGVILRSDDPDDLTKELFILKRMMMNTYVLPQKSK